MKKIIFSLVLILTVTAIYAQKTCDKDVPSEVKSKFTSLYPCVCKVDWSQEAGKYEAEFKDKEVETSVLIDTNGNLLETEQGIQICCLPESVASYVSSNYPGKKIKEAAKITDNNGVITFEAEVDHQDLMFDKDGKFITVSLEQN